MDGYVRTPLPTSRLGELNGSAVAYGCQGPRTPVFRLASAPKTLEAPCTVKRRSTVPIPTLLTIASPARNRQTAEYLDPGQSARKAISWINAHTKDVTGSRTYGVVISWTRFASRGAVSPHGSCALRNARRTLSDSNVLAILEIPDIL